MNDPFGFLLDLEEALENPGLGTTEPDPAAALGLAVALGRCRLFGIDPGDLDGTLPPAIARAAARELRAALEELDRLARTLGPRWDDMDLVEAEELCLDLVERRMDAWAAELVVAVPRGLLAAVDGAMQAPETLALLATAAETRLLVNWRAGLAAAGHAGPLPWWLDGTLEAAAGRNAQAAFATMPSEAAWWRARFHRVSPN